MASNQELIANIKSMSEHKGLEMPDVDEKSNKELAAVLGEIRNADAAEDSPAATEAAEKAAAEEEKAAVAAKRDEDAAAANKAKAKRPAHVIAEGKSLTTKRGILDADEGVSEKDLPGGKAAFDKLVKAGYIVKG